MAQGKKISSLSNEVASLAEIEGLQTLGVDSSNRSAKVLLGRILKELVGRVGTIYNVDNEHPLDDEFYTLELAIATISSDKNVTDENKNGMLLIFFDGEVWRMWQFQKQYNANDGVDPKTKFLDRNNWMELAVATNISRKADVEWVESQLKKKANFDEVYTKKQMDESLQEKVDKTTFKELSNKVEKKANTSDVYTKTEIDSKLNKKIDADQGKDNSGKVLTVNSEGYVVPAEASSDGNTINLGKPKEGYYTLSTALEAVKSNKRKAGLCITYMFADGVWATKQFVSNDIDNWSNEEFWADVTGGNIEVDDTLNQESENPVANKAVAKRIFDLENNAITEIDDTLNQDSTNPIQNAAVATAVAELKNPTFNSDVEEVEDGQQVTLSTIEGQKVAQFVVAAGGGGGTSTSSKILLSANVTANKVKEGGHSVLRWYYNHVNSEGEADGISGDITVTIKRGAITLHEETLSNVTPSTSEHTITLDAWLTTSGTISATVRASAIDNGVVQSKQFYVTVTVVQLSLELNNASTLINKAMVGGYVDGETIVVGYTIKGSGSKEISLFVDDNTIPTTNTVTRSGTTNGQFTLSANTLSPGRHVLQIVAMNDDLSSESSYIDILKSGNSDPFIGLFFTRDDGAIFSTDYLSPSVLATQYATSSFSYFAYDPASTMAVLNEYRNGVLNQTFSVGRARQTYSNRYTESGVVPERYECGNVSYIFYIDVQPSTIDVNKATANLNFELSASGRSNEESNPAVWTSEDVTTDFYNFDWKSSGWNGDALILKNGAKIVVNAYPFDQLVDPAASGKTIEMEFKISNVIDNSADLISCISGGKGFRISGSKASMLTGSSVTYIDEEDQEQTRIVGVEKTFATDIDIKMAFVIGQRSQHRLMELYINGTREKADIYNTTDNFVQDIPVGITIDSAVADIELRNIRVYDAALTDDEEVDNYIVDRKTVTEMLTKYDENDVLENGMYDITKILSRGKGVVHFIRPKGLDEVNSANNKSTDFITQVIYYSPFGAEWDFKIGDITTNPTTNVQEVQNGCNVRIQGTSSTKYPRKNYRIYLQKPKTAKFYRKDNNGAWIEDTNFDGYKFRESVREAPLVCLKADYSDSSMTMNTGGAKLFDALMRELGYLTPPQVVDSNVRQAVDGFPVDVFCTDTNDETNAVKYYGQYNFNHDKSKSHNIFGHVDITDENNSNFLYSDSIALEGLNNTNPFCLFQAKGSANSEVLSSQLDLDFDGAFEFNHPEDTVWAKNPASGKTSATDKQRIAIKRLFGWIHDCVASSVGVTSGTMNIDNPDYGTPEGWSEESRNKWVSAKFKNELQDYFVVNHLLTYYIYTDYFMSVDQRAKNTIFRTWDHEHWYVTYYDGDTQLGKRNDSFLAYLYTITRDTWDSDKSKYGFEGHDSWLWCLILANFADELKAAAKAMRNVLTNDVVLTMLNVEQQGNWCERAYNKSGEFKYILPATEGVTVIQNGVSTQGHIYPFIYALDGTNYSHRVHTILHRFALLDAKYGCDSYRGDNVEMYLSRLATDIPGTIKIRSNAPYFFDWNTKNGAHNDPQEAEEGDEVTLTFTGAITVNDPIDLFGASRMESINLSGVAKSIQNGINLNKATLLREIIASSSSVLTQTWFFNFEQCTRVKLIDCTNHVGVKTGTNSSTEFNVAKQSRLETLRLGGTAVQSIELAEGAPLTELVLPNTLTVLKLRYLPLLQTEGLTIEGYSNITTINFANCPGLDWVSLALSCPNLDRLRVEGVDLEDDGTLLLRFKDLRGIDADGNAVPKCQLIGDVYLTRFLDNDTMAMFKNAYPNLNIHLPEYTSFEFDDTKADPANITNLENGSTYNDENGYVPSGHVQVVHDNFIPVYGKLNDEGNMEVRRISESNYQQLPDGSSYDYRDTEGKGYDVFKLFPHCWIKGINDYKNQKKYVLWSSNDKCPSSSAKNIMRTTLADSLYAEGFAVAVNAIQVNTSTIESSGVLIGENSVNTYRVNVKGMRQVRYPGVNNEYIGACFVNESGIIIRKYSMYIQHSFFDFAKGDYLFIDVPNGATEMYFTCENTIDQATEIISVDSNKIEAIEPDWVEVNPFLVGIYQASYGGNKLRSLSGSTVKTGTGNATTWSGWNYTNEGIPTNVVINPENFTCKDFQNLAYLRGNGYQLVDYEMNKMVALLFYCYIGHRDASLLCGYGKSAGGNTGYMDSTGNDDGIRVTPNSGSGNKCLGLESWFGCTYEWMDRVLVNVQSYKNALANRMVGVSTDKIDGIWHIYDPTTDTERTVKGITTSGSNIGRVKNGRYCDIIPSMLVGDSEYATFYCDIYYYSGGSCRVVGRSVHYASAVGGLAYANAVYASSFSDANFGGRLAFRPSKGKNIILVE